MRRLGLWILVLVTGLAVLRLLSNRDSNSKTGLNHWDNDHLELSDRGISQVITTTRRIMKETNSMTKAKSKTEIDPKNFYVEDYPHFDPTPNSKASIKNGPIEHGTPLMPYIPRPNPPAATPRCASGSAPGPLNQTVFCPPPHM